MQSERHNSVKIELTIDRKAQEGIIVWIHRNFLISMREILFENKATNTL